MTNKPTNIILEKYFAGANSTSLLGKAKYRGRLHKIEAVGAHFSW